MGRSGQAIHVTDMSVYLFVYSHQQREMCKAVVTRELENILNKSAPLTTTEMRPNFKEQVLAGWPLCLVWPCVLVEA